MPRWPRTRGPRGDDHLLDSAAREGRSAMRTYVALLLAAVFAVHPLGGVAGEQQSADVKRSGGASRGALRGFPPRQRTTTPGRSASTTPVLTPLGRPTHSAALAR